MQIYLLLLFGFYFAKSIYNWKLRVLVEEDNYKELINKRVFILYENLY